MAVELPIRGSVDQLVSGLKETKKSLEGVRDAYEDVGDVQREVIGSATKGQRSLQSATKQTDLEFDRQGKSVKELTAHIERLSKGQRKTNNVALVKKYNAEIAKTRVALNQTRKQADAAAKATQAGAIKSRAAFAALRTTIASTFAPLIAGAAVFEGVKQLISGVSEYEQTAADLQAITGATAETLDFLKQSAVEAGVETTIGATETLEAYKLIASAKPELLDNAEALAAITRETITLAEAAGGDLTTNATNLTDIMNQYSAGAEQASRFTNALAAGSKEGSADINQLAASFLASGSELKSANVQFEEGVGLLEGLAEKGKKGAEAGTALRNVVAKLSATDVLPKDAVTRLTSAGVNMDLLSDKSLSFTDRLRALAPVQNDANALVSVFGLENKAAAQILLGSVDRIDELTAAVTGTNVAQEQAAIRTRTARGEWVKLGNTIQATLLDNGEGLSGFLAGLIRFVRQGILFLKARVDDLKPTFELVTNSISRLWSAFQNLFPSIEATGDKASTFSKIIKFLNVPIKVLLTLLSFVVDGLSLAFEKFNEAKSNSKVIQTAFGRISQAVGALLNGLLALPQYVDGGLAAVRVFAVETLRAFAQVGTNVKNLLGEAFNIKKLVTEGTGDLEKAVEQAMVNPFKGIGAKASKAFNDGFNQEQATKQLKTVAATSSTTNSSTSTSTSSFSKTDAQAEKDRKKQLAEAKKAVAEKERLAKEEATARLAAMKEGQAKELAQEEFRFKDLKKRLDKFNIDATEATQQHEANKFEIKQRYIQDVADLENLSGEERIRLIYEQNKKEIEALESQLKANQGGSLGADQVKQLNLLKKQANDKFLEDLAKFQSDETKQLQEHEIAKLELLSGNFETQAEFEEFKQREILDIKLKYAKQALALIEQTQGAESSAALALRKTINEISADIEGLQSGGLAKEFNIYSLMGVDPNDPESKKVIAGIEAAAGSIIGLTQEMLGTKLQAAESAIQASEREISAIDSNIDKKEQELEEQISRDDLGLANNKTRVQEELELLRGQKEQEKVELNKAFKEKQKIQKQQAAIDTLTQSISLITASAQVFNSVASIPFVGPALGAALVGAMIASFVAAKTKVFQSISKQKAERGMVGLVRGRRHSRGGEPFGDHIEVEDGEAFGVLSRQATRSFGGAHEAFVNAANKHDRTQMAAVARQLAGQGPDRDLPNKISKTEAKIVNMKTSVEASLESKELKRNNALLEQLIADNRKPKVERNERERIETHGNHTRVIKRAV